MCFNFIAFKWDVLTEEGSLKAKDTWKGRAANVREEVERKRSRTVKTLNLKTSVWKER